MKIRLFPTVLTLCVATCSSQAAILASWDVSTTTANQTSLAGTVTTGVASASLTATGQETAGSFGYSKLVKTTNALSADAIGSYFQFTVSADSGKVLNLDTLSVNAFNITSTAAVPAFSKPFVSSQIFAYPNGYSGYNAANNITPITTIGAGTIYSSPITLSGNSALQGLTSITFRVYGWRGSNDNTEGGLRIDDNGTTELSLTGTSVNAVPEISSAVPLLGLLSFSVLGHRKRRLS